MARVYERESNVSRTRCLAPPTGLDPVRPRVATAIPRATGPFGSTLRPLPLTGVAERLPCCDAKQCHDRRRIPRQPARGSPARNEGGAHGHQTCPYTYNGQPLAYAALASQKHYLSVYLMGIYGSEELRADFEQSYRASGKRMDIGKACVRFRTLDDLPLDVVANAIGALTIEEFIAMHDPPSANSVGDG